MADEEKTKKERARRTNYLDYDPGSLDVLLREFDKTNSYDKARDSAGKVYARFRELSRPQIRHLCHLHRVHGKNQHAAKKPVVVGEVDAVTRYMAVIGQAKVNLTDVEFERVMDYGMYLVGRK